MDNQVSEKIPILRGVRQGDPISPKLFTATIQVFIYAKPEEKGIKIDGEELSDLRFEDCVDLATEGVKDMKHRLNTERRKHKEWSQDTYRKTKFMTSIDTTDNNTNRRDRNREGD